MQPPQRSDFRVRFPSPVHPLSFKEAIMYDDSDFALYLAMFILIMIVITSA